MEYTLLIGAVFLATTNNVLLHMKKSKGLKSAFLFNFYVSIIWIIMLLVLLGRIPHFTPVTVFYGCLYGVFQGLFLFFKMQSMATGPISVTTLLGNCSLILSTALGIFLFSEKVNFLQIVGVLFLIVAMVLTTKSSDNMVLTKKWGFYCSGFFIIAGSIGVIMKLFSKAAPNEVGSIILISAFVMAIVYFILYMVTSFKDKTPVAFGKTEYILAFCCGLVSCGYNRLNGYLAGVIDSIIFYPIFNGATILFSALFGCLLFGERFTKRQTVGFAVGLVALLLAGNFLNILF